MLDKLNTKRPPVWVPGKNLVLTALALVAEVEYGAWTNDGSCGASFKGLRDPDDVSDIYRLPD
ncbi:hypothetical protein [Neorhizobium sp. LjRoot104]|uniref:hypothetical protein n=1 Tax=Neorhizobium sp. LjRoot104 TaxID=3342254 RepID=UPI003ECEEEB3